MGVMPLHDPLPTRGGPADAARSASAWARYRALMKWMALAAFVAVLLALLYLKATGVSVPLHMAIATIAGVGFSVLLGTALMGLVFLSNNSGHDEGAHRSTTSMGSHDETAAGGERDDR